jgi:ribosome-binding protein aMBF1 (putative translation factor)
MATQTTLMTTEIQASGVMREARRQGRLTQLALARRVNCTESLISKIETGRARPETWLKEAIARELGIRTWEVGE